jgi:hypothetical protein
MRDVLPMLSPKDPLILRTSKPHAMPFDIGE